MIDIIRVSGFNLFNNSQEVEIIFHNNNVTLPLKSMLPESYSIIQKSGSRLHTDPDRKCIFIPTGYFNQAGNVLSLFHEFAHAHLNESAEPDDLDDELYLRDKYNHIGSNSFTEMEMDKFRKLVIKSEKLSWAYAIEEVNYYKDLGLNLEPDLTLNDLVEIAKQKLSSYYG